MDLNQKKNKKKKETGRWTKDEHSRFILGLVNYGKNWKRVEQLVGTRTGAQVRSHAQKFFNRLSKAKKNFYEQTDAQQDQTIKAALMSPEIQHETYDISVHKALSQNKPSSQCTFTDEQSPNQEESEVKITMKPPQLSPRIMELIRRQSGDGTRPIQYQKFIDVLGSQTNQIQNNITKKKTSEEFKAQVKDQVENMISAMQNQRLQLKNVASLLIAYITLYGDQLKQEDQSFFLKLVKNQNKWICYNRFFDLVDLPLLTPKTPKDQSKTRQRRKSFTLCQHSEQFKEDMNNVKKMLKTTPQSIIIPTVIRQLPAKDEQSQPKTVGFTQPLEELPTH